METPRKRNHAVWIGPLVVFGGAVSYFTVFARYPQLRDFPWINLPLVLAGLALSLLASFRAFARPATYRGKVLGSIGLLLSLALSALFVFYIFDLSYRLPRESARTAALIEAPEISLRDHEGRTVRLADLRGRKIVLTFYRGHW